MRFRLIREMPRVRLIPSQAALLPAQKVQKRPRRSWGSPWPLLLLMLIPAILIGALLFRYYTRGPRDVDTTSSSAPGGKNLTTWTSALTGTSLQSKSTTRRKYTTHVAPTTTESSVAESSTLQLQDKTVEGEQPQRTATYRNYALPSEPVPAKYAIIVTLTGSELVQANVTSAVNISFTPRKGLDRIVLKAVPGASQHLKMALLESPNTNGQKALEVARVTGILTGEFMEVVEVTLKKPVTQGVEHVLSLEHKYASPSAVASGPITRSAGLVRMELHPGNTHWVFPHFGTEYIKTPVTLTVRTHSNLTVVSNTPLSGGKPDVNSTMWEHRFLETLPMPLQKVAWIAFPTSALLQHPVSDKATIYAKEEPDANLTRTLKDSFNDLQKFMEPTPTLIKKLDFIMTHGEHQDSLGFIVLEQPADVTPTQICKVVAGQWFKHLLTPPGASPAETWFSEAGVQYMCLIATTSHDEELFQALKAELEECMNTTAAPSADTSAFLAFRMAHLILGDQEMKSALQRFVAANTFTKTTTDDQLAVFEPGLPKENLKPWLTIQQVITATVAVRDTYLNIFWDTSDPGTPERAPFVTNTDVWGVNVRVPDKMEVTWLTHDSIHEITGMPTAALLVNPGMAACYNVEHTPDMWKIIGRSMQANGTSALDLVSTWYLVKQSAAMYTPGGSDSLAMVSFMWTWTGLKENATAHAWDDVVDKVDAAANDTYTELQDLADEQKFKEKLGTLLETRLGMINSKDLMANKIPAVAANIQLANLACRTVQKKCQDFVPDGVFGTAKIDASFLSFVKTKTQLDPKAVACRLGALVETGTDFESRVDLSEADRTAIIHQLAFACCVAYGKATKSMMTFAKKVLLMNPAIKPEEVAIVSQSFRRAALNVLKTMELTNDEFGTGLRAAINLYFFRKSEDIMQVKVKAEQYEKLGRPFGKGFGNIGFKNVTAELKEWIQAP